MLDFIEDLYEWVKEGLKLTLLAIMLAFALILNKFKE